MARRGRPLKFETVEELQKQIDKYFRSIRKIKWADEIQRDKDGNILKDINDKQIKKPIKYYYNEPYPTITGMAVFLNTSRETLMDYEGRKDFSDTIKHAKDKIQASYEQSLLIRGNAGDIFALKNFGWVDKHEIEQKNLNIDVKDEDLADDIAKEMSKVLPEDE